MLNRRVRSNVDYILRIQTFVIKPRSGAVIPAKYAEDPIIDRHIRANILDGELLSDLLAKVEGAPAPTEVKEKTPEPAPIETESASGPVVESKEESVEDTPPEDEKPAEIKEEAPKPAAKKKSKKKASE